MTPYGGNSIPRAIIACGTFSHTRDEASAQNVTGSNRSRWATSQNKWCAKGRRLLRPLKRDIRSRLPPAQVADCQTLSGHR